MLAATALGITFFKRALVFVSDSTEEDYHAPKSADADDADDAVITRAAFSKKDPETRIFTQNKEINSGILGFGLGIGGALLVGAFLDDAKKKQTTDPCHNRYKRDDVQPRFALFGGGGNNDYRDCPPNTAYGAPPPPSTGYGHPRPDYGQPKPGYGVPSSHRPDYHGSVPPPSSSYGYRDPAPSYHDPHRGSSSSSYKPMPHRDDYRDDYSSSSSYKPPHRDNYTPPHRDDYKPPHRDDYRPPQKDNYRPPHRDDYRPPHTDTYKPPLRY